jgi:RHS repeat-associated protein
VVVPEDGFIYIWLSNESEGTEVWFDDLSIRHTQTLVAQATDYGVWGEVLREQRADARKYRYGYQGSFSEKDEETGWNHFELREYDPVVGRWTSVDPKRVGFSPYIGMGNNPIYLADPDGGSPDNIIIKGKNNSSITIFTNLIEHETFLDVDFGDNHEFKLPGNIRIEDLAIGLQTYYSGSSTYLVGADVGVLKHNIMFFNKKYGGYWYTYIGGEGSIKAGLDVEILSVNSTISLVLGIHKNGGYSPETFAGSYYTGGLYADISAPFVAGTGPGVGAMVQFSSGTNWNIIEIGLTGTYSAASLGGAGVFGGVGKTRLINPVIPTSQRSIGDRIFNQVLFNPILPWNR